MNIWLCLFILLISYLFGSIPWALVIGKVFYHKDIRQYGSGNPGASNAGRILGKKVAVIVTLLDALKAFFSMAIAYLLIPSMVEFAGLACCLGHCFPVFARFKGGKAVATSYGYFLGLTVFLHLHWWWNFFFPVVMFFGILWLCRMVSLSSISAILAEVIASFVIGNPVSVSLSLLLLWLFVTYRHVGNIQRIIKGEESKIQWMGERHVKH